VKTLRSPPNHVATSTPILTLANRHPADSNILLATAARGGYGRDSQDETPAPAPFGVKRSIDGGATWTRTLNGGATALEVDSTNFNNQCAAIADQRIGVFHETPDAVANGVYRSVDGGQTWAVVTGPWGVSNSTTATVGRIELALAPSNPSMLYVSIQVPPNGGTSATGLLGLYKTDNAWAATPTWIQILRRATCDTYVYGTRGGQIWLTIDGGANWIDLDPAMMLPARPVNSLAFDPSNPDVLYAALSSFDDETPSKSGHVFRRSNVLSGPTASPQVATWVDVGPAADNPFNVVVVDPRNPQIVYAGSDVGLWRSTNGAASSARMGPATGLPNAPVYDIQISPATGRTVMFTYGRGAFVLSTTFTDEPFDASTVVKAVHIHELRGRIGLLRQRDSIGRFTWTNPIVTAGSTPVRGADVVDLRLALNDVYAALNRQLPSYTDTTLVASVTAVKAVHITELRAAVLAIE
jgi:hypothetical protein